MKRCFKCGIVKPIDSYYRHKMMSDGHLNKCKECTKKDVRKNRAERVDYYRNYDSWRFQARPHEAERRKAYASTEKGRESRRRAKLKFISNNPTARAAHVLLGAAVRSGKIRKPTICPICNEFTPSRKMHGHHEDYNNPLEVKWMCAMCHTKEHGRDSPHRGSLSVQ